MDTKNEIIRIWRECFPADPAAWVDMYFTHAYRQECAMTLERDNATVCSLLLQPYTMTFHGECVGASYVSGAATRPRFRNCGYMTELMKQALSASHDRDDMLCTLIPADSRLYFYYSKFGFSTVFYNTVLHYTSAHTFHVRKGYELVDPDATGALFNAFSDIMRHRTCCIQHDRSQFETIQADNRLCGGSFAAIADGSDGNIAAMAWAVPEPGSRSIRVMDVLARDEDSYNAVLHRLQLLRPGCSMTVMERPGYDSRVTLTPRGMARLLRPAQAFALIARSHPDLRVNVRVTDRLLPGNNAIYSLGHGQVDIHEYNSRTIALDLDVTIEVLTAIMFSSNHMGRIMGLPSERPFISLMLD